MKKVFMTGATGFIGSQLVHELTKRGIEVYALCNVDSPHLERIANLERVHIVYGKLEELDNVPDICKEVDFDVFFHLAWKGASGDLRRDCTTQVNNIVWTCKAAELALQLSCSKLVVTGTICEKQCDAISVADKFIGSSYYLTAKKSAYEMVRAYCKQNNMPLVWCTFYHPLGKYNKKDQLIINTIEKLLRGEELKFGKAQKWFDVIAVEDLCRGLYLAGKCNLEKDRYFIGSGTPRILYEYLEEVKNLIDPEAQMNYGGYPDDGLPMKREWLDITPFQKETCFRVECTFRDCVLGVLRWLEQEEIL